MSGNDSMEYQPRRVLVTGGAGFIGCNYIRYILDTDEKLFVVNLDLLTYAGSLKNLTGLRNEPRHVFVQGDICDRELIDRILVENDIDTIVHFAAESHVDRSISGPASFVQTNLVGTFTLLDAAKNCWLDCESPSDASRVRFHHISTDEVYGSLSDDDPPFNECTPYAPNSPYSAAKAGSDHLVRAYHHTFDLPVTTTNCSNNYGPYQHQEKLIPTIIRACLDRKPIPVYGDGSNVRDWLYVEDHCKGIDRVLRGGRIGEVYNIGGDNEQQNIAVVKTICGLLDDIVPMKEGSYTKLIEFVTDRPGHDWRYAIDAAKIQDELSWKPEMDFESGMRKTALWYLDHRNN